MSKTFLVGDETINSYKCRVLASGADTTAFESNPVMLFMHQRGNVIGKWKNLNQKEGQWYADAVFDLKDTRPGGGEEIGGKVDREFINAASKGIIILEAHYNEDLDCYDITKWRLQEISIVDIGSNANALQLYDMAGEPLSELKLAAHLEQFKGVPREGSPQEGVTPPDTILPTQSTKPMETIKLSALAIALGLAETATQEQVLTLAATGQKAIVDLTALKLRMAADQERDATNLVETAITEQRIPATQKDAYLKLFAADHESAKTILASIPKPQNLVTFATQGQTVNAMQNLTATEDDKKKYEQMDKAGTLLQLAQADFPAYSRLFKAKFGKEPDKIVIA